MTYFRAALFVLAMAAAVLLAAPFQALARRRGWVIGDEIQKAFCRLMCRVIGIEISPCGALPGAGPRVVVANHLSWTDVIALASLYPFVFLAKREVAGWPILGLLARLQGTVFVERGARQTVPSVNAALSAALDARRDLLLFPEGTSTDGAKPPRFKSAHFDVACESGASVVPVALFYTDGEATIDVGWYGEMSFLPHLWGLMKRGGARCHILFGEAIDARGKDRKTVAAEAQSQVRDMLRRGQHVAQSEQALETIGRRLEEAR